MPHAKLFDPSAQGTVSLLSAASPAYCLLLLRAQVLLLLVRSSALLLQVVLELHAVQVRNMHLIGPHLVSTIDIDSSLLYEGS